MSSIPSPCLPPSPIQSEKAKRYDRQLRQVFDDLLRQIVPLFHFGYEQ